MILKLSSLNFFSSLQCNFQDFLRISKYDLSVIQYIICSSELTIYNISWKESNDSY